MKAWHHVGANLLVLHTVPTLGSILVACVDQEAVFGILWRSGEVRQCVERLLQVSIRRLVVRVS